MKKILIIGFGNMGFSHFTSFIKKNYIVHIIEKNNNKQILELKKNKLINKKYLYLKKFLQNKNIFLQFQQLHLGKGYLQ